MWIYKVISSPFEPQFHKVKLTVNLNEITKEVRIQTLVVCLLLFIYSVNM